MKENQKYEDDILSDFGFLLLVFVIVLIGSWTVCRRVG
jgi:hypothetical protein